MAITYVGKSSAMDTSAGGIGVRLPSTPAAYAAGDLLLLVLEGYDATPAEPSGWTTIDTQSTTKTFVRVCRKIAGGSESSVWVADSGDSTRGIMFAFRGVNTADPINATSKGVSNGTSYTAQNGLTTTVDGCMVVTCAGFWDADANDTSNYSGETNASLASITEAHDQATAAGSGGGIYVTYGIDTTAGTVNPTTATADNDANYSASVMVALKPPKAETKSITSTTTASSSFTEKTGKQQTSNTKATASQIKSANKTLVATSLSSSAVTRKNTKHLSASASASASFANVFKAAGAVVKVALTAGALFASAFIRSVSKTSSATAKATATETKATSKSSSANAIVTAGDAKKTARALLANALALSAVAKKAGKKLSASVSIISSAAKKTAKALTASVASVSSLAYKPITLILKALTASATAAGNFVRAIGKTETATTKASATQAKATGKTETANATASASSAKKAAKAFAVTISAFGALGRKVGKRLSSSSVLSSVLSFADGTFKQLIATVTATDYGATATEEDRQATLTVTDSDTTTTIEDRTATLTATNSTVTMEVEIVSLTGNTVRLKAEFKDFEGALVSPTSVVLKVYDGARVQVGTDIAVTPISTGTYAYDYELPDNADVMFYEFSGTVANKAILGRAALPITWI